MILHLADDVHIINSAYTLFEKHYPNQNVFIVQVARNQPSLNHVKQEKRIFFAPYTTTNGLRLIHQIAKQYEIKYVFVHYLSPTKAAIAIQLQKKLGARVGWFFFGADLYECLSKLGRYQLNDQPIQYGRQISLKNFMKNLFFLYRYGKMPFQAYSDFISRFDYFYFWNEYDFKLLKQHFICNAKFKPFAYYGLIDRSNRTITPDKSLKILVNHSASANGNHLTVLRRLDSIVQNVEIIVPISYGSAEIQRQIINYSLKSFKNRIQPLLQFVAIDEYYKLLRTIKVAIFGQRRQEGAANIFYLLSVGVKIFLRNENNMIQWLRDKGFIVFSFEDDLCSDRDLLPLSPLDAQKNYSIYNEVFSHQREVESMMKLLD